MAHETDHELLSKFVKDGSESAFSALVGRYVNLVYSAAFRHTGNPHHAEEITQAVFILLARKAGSISSRAVLSGWLYQTARLTAANHRRDSHRRLQREQQAFMESALNVPADESWKLIASVLDEAMGALAGTDRDAVLLRYFENHRLAEVGAALGVSEAAAEKRISRALERLRAILARQGVALGATAIAGAITANAVQAAPANMAATTTAAALAATSYAAATVAITTLKKFTVTAVLAATIGAAIYAGKQATDARKQIWELKDQQTSLLERIRELQASLTDATNRLIALTGENSDNGLEKNKLELLRLRGQVAAMRTQLAGMHDPKLQTTNVLQSTPVPQIHIQAKFIETPRDFVLPSSMAGMKGNQAKGFTGVLSSAQFQVVLHALEQKDGVNLLNESSVTTLSGRQCQISSSDDTAPGQPTGTGTQLDVFPDVSADRYTIKLKAIVAAPEKLDGEVNLYDHQTLVLSMKETTKPDSQLFVFLTTTLVDPAGNQVHSEDDPTFPQNGSPPQN